MRRVWLLLVFAAVLALWLWRAPHDSAPGGSTPGADDAAEPGYVATEAQLIDTDADGRPLYQLRASHISQSSPSSDIELTSPRFLYQGDTAWTVTAQRGVLPPSAQQVELLGEVVARAERIGAVPMELRTRNLSVDMQARSAVATGAVVMEWGRNRLWAAGLHADMKADDLRLESPVHGEFAQR